MIGRNERVGRGPERQEGEGEWKGWEDGESVSGRKSEMTAEG